MSDHDSGRMSEQGKTKVIKCTCGFATRDPLCPYNHEKPEPSPNYRRVQEQLNEYRRLK
jgi:hypothetical protein